MPGAAGATPGDRSARGGAAGENVRRRSVDGTECPGGHDGPRDLEGRTAGDRGRHHARAGKRPMAGEAVKLDLTAVVGVPAGRLEDGEAEADRYDEREKDESRASVTGHDRFASLRLATGSVKKTWSPGRRGRRKRRQRCRDRQTRVVQAQTSMLYGGSCPVPWPETHLWSVKQH